MVLKRLILLGLLITGSAYSTTITLNQIDGNLGESITFSDYGNVATNWAGGVDATVAGYARVLYCVQLKVNISVPGTYDSILDFADSASLQRVGWLMQYHAPTNPADGAGFQLALWDILQDGADGFDSGNVMTVLATDTNAATPTDVVTAANHYEAISAGMSGTEAVIYKNFTLGGDPQQTLIGFWVTDSGPSPAPEPSVILLIFSGLVLIGLSRVRRGAPRLCGATARPDPGCAPRHP
jgi:hypothetical protein